ncbi:hypothetical protein [Emticicia sp. BO119]|uniref:hypothetical protein n=1 Tax=Emticicia sp. BO119 TaxID=2757768 RepID=UPI0015F04ED6|nr:hypothetical protein [Emticicia sp. BO119]MBA4850463.1 hypothetical protein [Emticicia sp. BO119]
MKTIIPAQREGTAYDTISEKIFPTEKLAKAHFNVVRDRLLAINHWHKVSADEKTVFELVDGRGEQVERLPAIGDFIRIDIPGPINHTGNGFDWVKIEDIFEDEEIHEEFISIRVRPSSNPEKHSPEVAHFFDDTATSTFIVKRESNKISAEVHGRNEKPNLEDVDLIDKIRNTFVAFGGILGASKIQWKSFTEGLLT